ncbi:stanniocalcin-like [Babylonia areolata]|uniref:stanniocalcin-like n=1 Tax=Babylonia areolata TaxID=304850 RepID=UPI003FD465B7
MMKVVVVAMVMLMCRSSAGWFLGNRERTAVSGGRPVDEECVEEGEAGGCEFFNCFEERLPCGRDFYMQRYGNYYCRRFQRYMANFTAEGQTFLLDSQQCITESLLEYYRRNDLNCHELEHAAIALIRPCYIRHGFCGIIRDNKEPFLQVFQLRDLFRSGALKLWRELAGLARECGRSAFSEFLRATTNRFSFLRALIGGDEDDK